MPGSVCGVSDQNMLNRVGSILQQLLSQKYFHQQQMKHYLTHVSKYAGDSNNYMVKAMIKEAIIDARKCNVSNQTMLNHVVWYQVVYCWIVHVIQLVKDPIL